MWISAAFLLFALAVNGVKSHGRKCPTGWEKLGPQCFKFFSDLKPWADAEAKVFHRNEPIRPYLGKSIVLFASQLHKHGGQHSRAQKHCLDLGGNLASIHDQRTNSFLKSFLKKCANAVPRTWIGGHDATKNGVWFWSDGSQFDYCDWLTGEPNNLGGHENCVELAFGAYLTVNFLNNVTEFPQLSNAGMMQAVTLLSVSSV
ncbi:hypothetical protein cypCar_00047601 [Cyprinus carpio]|nr:hypothetical protein cypCar_00047601 [Cyprinus carpio]